MALNGEEIASQHNKLKLGQHDKLNIGRKRTLMLMAISPLIDQLNHQTPLRRRLRYRSPLSPPGQKIPS